MMKHERLVAIFTEWDRRAADGGWGGNPPDPEMSARIFAEIARSLYPTDDGFGEWLRLRVLADPTCEIPVLDVLQDYREFCVNRNIPAEQELTRQVFFNRLDAAGFLRVKRRGVCCRRGLRLRSSVEAAS